MDSAKIERCLEIEIDDLVMVADSFSHKGWQNRGARVVTQNADGQVSIELFVEPFERVWMKPADLVGPITDMCFLRERCMDMPECDVGGIGFELYARYTKRGRVGV